MSSFKRKELAKKILLPYHTIIEQDRIIKRQKNYLDEFYQNIPLLEKTFMQNYKIIKTRKLENIKLNNNHTLLKYKLTDGFYSGINNIYPGSGFIDTHKEKIIILSARGFLGFSSINEDEFSFQKIDNNIKEFINSDQFNKDRSFSIKDLTINKDNIFASYTEEIEPDCFNTSVIYGKFNYKNIYFKKIFSPKNCIHSKNNLDGEFEGNQSGGRIVIFDDNHILLSIGDYRARYLAQKKNSVNGKILKININNSEYKIISMGHRNPQGLYFDKENNYVLETEHGPQGGDEINLIQFNVTKKNVLPNYGWPISSAGEHYGGKVPRNNEKYRKYPLHKSHKKYGFVEPLKSFVPSVAISEIIKIDKKEYVVSTLRSKSLYKFRLNDKNKITDLTKIPIYERVRDLKFIDNKLYLFLESTASIGIVSLNEN